MTRIENNPPVDIKKALLMNSQTLAFLGDAVYTLFIRMKILEEKEYKISKLHNLTSEYVKAKAQAVTADTIFDSLNENEKVIYTRARNKKTKYSAKNAKISDYHKATAFEAVIGFLYITRQDERLEEIIKRGLKIE